MIIKLKKCKPTPQQDKQRKRQKDRIKREEAIWEMIQLPNGDFKKVMKKAPR